MKCKKLFALLLSLCMVVSTIVALPVSAATENVIDIDLPLDDASELTWAQPGVTVSNADDIGGRDNVVMVAGLSNSNNNTAGVKLPEGFAFQAGDVLTYSLDVYSDAEINPDMWLRNHGSALNPFATLYEQTITASTWTTITKTFTFEELEAKIADSNSSGTFASSDNYVLYIRPRQNATAYLDNFKVTVSRPVVERENVIDIEVNSASDVTWLNGGTAADADGIGGRDGVVALGNLANANGNTAGVILADSFGFKEGDILTYSLDVYSDTVTNPDLWLRNHGSSLNPFTTFYHEAPTSTWTTITKTVKYADLIAAGAFDAADKYALYLRPRQSGTVYVDNFKVTVSRVKTDEPHEHVWDEGVVTVEPTTETEGVKTYTCECGETYTEVIEKLPAPENRANVIDIDLPLDVASELTWVASSSVTVSEADGIGGRDNVLKAEGLANSNNNSVGVKLPDDFAFDASDILTYSIDVYSETAVSPDVWLRNHGSSLNPVATFYHEPLATGTWTTITKTVTYEEMMAAAAAMNSSGDYASSGKYALYIRPRNNATLYLDNFKVTVSRVVEMRGNVIDIEVDSASDITWVATSSVTVSDENGIGGRDGVIKLAGLADSNNNTAGVVLADSFAFEEGDILTYKFDIYSESAINPDVWVRNHGSSLSPFITLYQDLITANTWTTITKEVKYADLMAKGAFDAADKYALYIRPRQNATVYIDNFTVTVSRVDYIEPCKHEYGAWETDGDENHKATCSLCSEVVTEAHTWDEGVVTVEPTYTATGVKTITCAKCGATKEEVVDKLPLPEIRENVIDITADSASDITWTNGGTAADADGIGGRDGVIELANLANSNGNTAGVKLPDGFAFQEGDILTYSFDAYSDTITNPDVWIRNHDSSLSPFAPYYHTITLGEWTTITKTATYDELVAQSINSNSSGAMDTAGNYALYLRPRQSGTVYVDNLKVTVSRVVTRKGSIINEKADAASEFTWVQPGVTVSDADGIGGRDNVVKVEGLADNNNATAGIKLPENITFKPGDVLKFSVDVYTETPINPDFWLRNASTEPFTVFYQQPIDVNTWTTIAKTVSYEEWTTTNSTGDWTTTGNFALYMRPRIITRSVGATVYFDNFSVAVEREGYCDVTFKVEGQADIVVGVAAGEAIGANMPADPVVEGYIFKGWKDENGNNVTADTVVLAPFTVTTVLEKVHTHEYTEEVTLAPTCVDEGVKTFTCECGHSYTEAIPATGEHTWDAGVVTTEPAVGVEGVKTYTCTVCSETKTEVIPPLPTPVTPALITIGDVEAKAGEEIKVPLSIKDNPGIVGFILDVTFDTNVLTYINATPSTALGNLTLTTPGNVNAQPLVFLWDGLDADNTNGEFVVLTFKVADTATASEYAISASIRSVYDQDLNDVNVIIENGTVEVTDFMFGDVNDDGLVEIKDIVLLRRYITGGYGVTINERAADVNHDGNIMVSDLVLIRRYIAGGYGIEF